MNSVLCRLLYDLCPLLLSNLSTDESRKKMTSLTSLHASGGREKTNERRKEKTGGAREERWEDEEAGARRKKKRKKEGGRNKEEMGAEDKEKRQGEKREGGCCRLGMPGKRSAASSALLFDKLRKTVAWINPLLSYLLRCRAFHRWVYKWVPVG